MRRGPLKSCEVANDMKLWLWLETLSIDQADIYSFKVKKETLEQGVKYFKVNNKDTRKTAMVELEFKKEKYERSPTKGSRKATARERETN